MTRRLVDRFKLGQHVLIRFGDSGDDWVQATVIAADHPGLWVQTEDKRMWYVTNNRRIKVHEGAA
ncbi:MAG: hypothetical protein R3300_10960 [Candidatus Promineifilaceae bacterium]|nr:hypothetical protein [Candidatus Promineifilaceae bacterium]